LGLVSSAGFWLFFGAKKEPKNEKSQNLALLGSFRFLALFLAPKKSQNHALLVSKKK
jgi:hypothetical protein